MPIDNRYRDFFLDPVLSRHKRYEILRSRFVDRIPISDIADNFAMSPYSIQTYIRDFKKSVAQGEPEEFFLELSTGPKTDRKKPKVREQIILLRARGYAGTDICKALKLTEHPVSLSLIDQVLGEEGLLGMLKRTRREREDIAREIESGQITGPAAPQTPAVANVADLDLREERNLYTRVAGIFLFVPFLVNVDFEGIVQRARVAGTKMIPAVSYILSLLALKLLDKERKSHISDWNFDEALGLFAGLNIMPKTTAATDYSYRLQARQHQVLVAQWVRAVYPVLCGEEVSAFALDFHAIPHRGENTGLENHYVPMRGTGRQSILTFFVRTIDQPMLCYANADILRREQNQMPLEFVEYWKNLTGVTPDWLYFDSRLTTYDVLDQLRSAKINFVTIRRRGGNIVANLAKRPASEWKSAVINTPKRRRQKIRYLDDPLQLKNYTGRCRQVAVTGLGREKPTLFLTNNDKVSGREIITRYINRNSIENELGINVNFFHMDCLSSEVRLNVDLDVAMTVIANGCYRWLANSLKGCAKMEPKQLYRKFVETGGNIKINGDDIIVKLDRRSHNPIIRQTQLDREPINVPWLNGKRLHFDFA